MQQLSKNTRQQKFPCKIKPLERSARFGTIRKMVVDSAQAENPTFLKELIWREFSCRFMAFPIRHKVVLNLNTNA